MSLVSEHKQKREFLCTVCGRTFSPTYRLSRHRVLSACSKLCAGKLKGGEFHRKSDLEKAAITAIHAAGKYLTRGDIQIALSVSSKTLNAYGVSTLECNKIAGYKMPSRCFENAILEVLTTKFSVKTEVKFDDCLSPKGVPLRFDFYVEDRALLIEADGSQHKAGHPWHRPYHAECDAIKEAYAELNGMRLIRIPYSKRVTSRYVFSFLETKTATT